MKIVAGGREHADALRAAHPRNFCRSRGKPELADIHIVRCVDDLRPQHAALCDGVSEEPLR